MYIVGKRYVRWIILLSNHVNNKTITRSLAEEILVKSNKILYVQHLMITNTLIVVRYIGKSE